MTGGDLVPVGGTLHPPTAYLARLSVGSRPTQARALNTLALLASGGRAGADVFAWHTLTYSHTQAVRAALAERYAPQTVNRHLAALRGVLKECWRAKLIDAETYTHAVDLENVPSDGRTTGRALSQAELDALLGAGATAGARDLALLSLLALGGLRVTEAVSMPWPSDGALDVLTVRGKRNRVREVPLPGRAQRALAALPREGARMFSLSVRSAEYLVERTAVAAGLAHLTPHDLRRSYITALLSAGVDPLIVAQLAGHAKVDTTRLYDRRPLDVARAAVARLEAWA